jgi:peptide deformylase
MLVWTEGCLVLPPEFRATLLRDAEVTIEYESLLDDDDGDDNIMGLTKQITLRGELARCAQHEMDHDRGILIVDHVPLEETALL